MGGPGLRRRTVLLGMGGASVSFLGRSALGHGRDPATGPASDLGNPGLWTVQDCTPGHTDGDSVCQQVADDSEVLVTLDVAGTPLPISTRYPCGWTADIGEHADQIRAQVRRRDIGGNDGSYASVQISVYTEPVSASFIEDQKASGDYQEEEYGYDGESRTGLVSSPETDQYGTLAHAAVPFQDALVHVELYSTLKGADCDIDPRPDFGLVRDMLGSLEPNLDTTFPETSDAFESRERVWLHDGAEIVQKAADQPIGGGSSLSGGQDVTVKLRSSEPQPLLRTKTVQTNSSGDWIARFDLSDVPAGQDFDLEVAALGETKVQTTGTVVQPASIVASNQRTEDGRTLFVDSIRVPNGGFAVVHRAGDVAILGNSKPLSPGLHNDVEVVLDDPLPDGSTDLLAVAHENGGVATFSADEDPPYEVGGKPVSDPVTATVPTPTTPTTRTTTTPPTTTATATTTTTTTTTTVPASTPTRQTTATGEDGEGDHAGGAGMGIVPAVAGLASAVYLLARGSTDGD